MQGSLPSDVPMSPSSQNGFAGSRCGSSHYGTNIPATRNLDVTPGIEYFETATDILDSQLAGTTLRHVYANILAALYHGQLGRVLESYVYIRQASYVLQTKLIW